MQTGDQALPIGSSNKIIYPSAAHQCQISASALRQYKAASTLIKSRTSFHCIRTGAADASPWLPASASSPWRQGAFLPSALSQPQALPSLAEPSSWLEHPKEGSPCEYQKAGQSAQNVLPLLQMCLRLTLPRYVVLRHLPLVVPFCRLRHWIVPEDSGVQQRKVWRNVQQLYNIKTRLPARAFPLDVRSKANRRSQVVVLQQG
jgi:hypothetical protein